MGANGLTVLNTGAGKICSSQSIGLSSLNIAILDRQKYLLEDFTTILDTETFAMQRAHSGLELLEMVAGPQLNNEEPSCDVAVIPHEVDAHEGAQLCHMLRRLYNAKKLIILVLIPPFVDENVTYNYLAAEVNEICVFPLSRLAISSKFSLYADLVQAQCRSKKLSAFELGVAAIKNDRERASEIARILRTDCVVQNVTILNVKSEKSSKSFRKKRRRICELSLGSYAVMIEAKAALSFDDIRFFKAFLHAAKRHQSSTLELSTIEGLNLVRDQHTEIRGIKGANQYCEIIYHSGSRHLVRNTPLKTIQSHFTRDFTRCHKSWLVSNTVPWRSFHKGRGRYIIAAESFFVPIGDRFLPEIRRSRPDWFVT
jgi:DNA-binding LytR/AlgR family response regulator